MEIRYKSVSGLAIRNSRPLPWYKRLLYSYLERNPPKRGFTILAFSLLGGGSILALLGYGLAQLEIVGPIWVALGIYSVSRSRYLLGRD